MDAINIFRAVKKNNISYVEKSLTYDSINKKLKNGTTPLMLSVRLNYYDLSKYLISNGADVNSVKGEGITSIFYAVENNNLEMVKLLLENGANLNYKDVFSSGIISYLKRPTIAIAKLFVKYNLNITELSKLIYSCIKNDNLPLFNYLIENGVDLNSNNFLEYAFLHSNLDWFELLLKSGANPNYTNEFGSTTFHYISGYYKVPKNYLDFLKLAINYGFNINIINKFGATILINSIVSNCSLDVIKYLLEKGVYTYYYYQGNKHCFLDYILHNDSLKNISVLDLKYIISKIDDIQNYKYFYESILCRYAICGNLECVKYLINFVKNLNDCDNDWGNTILMQLAWCKSNDSTLEIARFLIKNGANPYLKNRNGVDAFYYAKDNPQLMEIYKEYKEIF